jgi:hypothetical protein
VAARQQTAVATTSDRDDIVALATPVLGTPVSTSELFRMNIEAIDLFNAV